MAGPLAVFNAFVLFEDDVLLPVAVELPFVIGVSFGNVDNVKVGLILKGVVQSVQLAELLTKGRSGVTAKQQHAGAGV